MKPKDFLPVEIMNEYVNQKSQYIALPCKISDLGIITDSPKLYKNCMASHENSTVTLQVSRI